MEYVIWRKRRPEYMSVTVSGRAAITSPRVADSWSTLNTLLAYKDREKLRLSL